MKPWLGLGLCSVAVGVLGALAACSAEADKTEAASDAVIGGTDATSASWNAVGALGRRYVGGQTRSFCTGTLISPTVVLTARHCAMEEHTTPGSPTHTDTGTVYFMIGFNAGQPQRIVKATSATPASIYRGGYTGLGSDVALYTLSEPINDIVPAKVAVNPPKGGAEGQQYIAIGYGVQDAQGHSQTRKMGKVTLRTVTGQPAHLAFPNVEAYIASVDEFNPEPMTDAQKEAARVSFDRPVSLDYEGLTGAVSPGDVQICNGDSGGPLLKQENGGLVVYGVASTTISKTGFLCKNGSIHALFGASTRQMIAKAINQSCFPKEGGGLECVNGVAPPRECKVVTEENKKDAADGGAPSDPAFDACVSNNCCAETTACLGDTECQALRECFSGCSALAAPTDADGGAPAPPAADAGPTPAQQCSNECYKARPQVYARYLGFTSCIRSQCATAVTPAADAGTP